MNASPSILNSSWLEHHDPDQVPIRLLPLTVYFFK